MMLFFFAVVLEVWQWWRKIFFSFFSPIQMSGTVCRVLCPSCPIPFLSPHSFFLLFLIFHIFWKLHGFLGAVCVALTCRQYLTFWQGEGDFLSVMEVPLPPVSVGFWQGSPAMVPWTPPGALHPGWWWFALGGKEHGRRAAREASPRLPAPLRWKRGLKGRSGEDDHEHPNLQCCPWRKLGSGIVVFYPSCREVIQLLCALWWPVALCLRDFCCCSQLPKCLVTRIGKSQASGWGWRELDEWGLCSESWSD